MDPLVQGTQHPEISFINPTIGKDKAKLVASAQKADGKKTKSPNKRPITADVISYCIDTKTYLDLKVTPPPNPYPN